MNEDEKDERIFDRIKEFLPTPEEIASRLRDELLEVEHKLQHGGRGLGLYILNGHEPVPIEDTLEWARWFENHANRRVACTSVNGWQVSTVFLGIDNNYFSKHPLLFETMIFSETEKVESKLLKRAFRKSLDNYQRRYHTWDEALKGHEEAVAYIREGLQ
jgi:hypothetical protein